MKLLYVVLAFITSVAFMDTAKSIMNHNATTAVVTNDSLAFYRNSFLELSKKPKMNSEVFIKAYKYDKLFKYYTLCKKKPSNWKYYKGWSIRTFEEK